MNIEVGDTVRVEGYPRRGEVEIIRGATAYRATSMTVGFTWHVGRDIRTMTVDVAPDRVTLVRKGNRTDDLIRAMFANMDAQAAYRAGTATEAEAIAARERLLAVLDD